MKKRNAALNSFEPTPLGLSARRYALATLALMLPMLGAGLLYGRFPTAQVSPEFAAPVPSSTLAKTTASLDAPVAAVIEKVIGRNDTLERVFRQARLSLDDLAAIRSLPGLQGTIDIVKPGDLITLSHVDGVLQTLTRRLSETEVLKISRETSGFAAQILQTPVEIHTTAARGTIDSSLFNAARANGVSSEVVMRLANDVFGWDIDFALDIQPQDQFAVIYEQKYRDDQYLGDGEILAAEFVNEGHTYRALRFESKDGAVADFFTPDGKSMRRQFLRAPVDFKYISSGFSLRRLHPLLNIVRAHQGVDYSAPTGTPIRASGDGRVSQIGSQGGYGNAIILEHGGGISTLYGHLSRFAKNLRPGARVHQGDVIGFVGSTGTATGPHLHYEYRVNGIHKNPRTVPLPDAQSIPPAYAAEFDAVKNGLLQRLAALDASRTIPRP